jgi:hypothetical protein
MHLYQDRGLITCASPSTFIPSFEEMIFAKSSTRKAQLMVALAKATFPLAGENSKAGRNDPSGRV